MGEYAQSIVLYADIIVNAKDREEAEKKISEFLNEHYLTSESYKDMEINWGEFERVDDVKVVKNG